MKSFKDFFAARLWTIFTVLAVISLLMGGWLVTPSSILFRPVEWRYNPETGEATFTRVISSGRPILVRWAHIVYVPDGPACSDSDVRFYDGRTQVETIPIREGLRRCLDNPDNVAVLTWQPYLWGLIPLRPYAMTVPAGAEIPRR